MDAAEIQPGLGERVRDLITSNWSGTTSLRGLRAEAAAHQEDLDLGYTKCLRPGSDKRPSMCIFHYQIVILISQIRGPGLGYSGHVCVGVFLVQVDAIKIFFSVCVSLRVWQYV